MKGNVIMRAALGALVFAATAFSAQSQRQVDRRNTLLAGGIINDPQSGRDNYRGGHGTRTAQRAAQKRRNVVRNRRAHRA